MNGGRKVKKRMLFGIVLSLLMICFLSPTSLVPQVKAAGAGDEINRTTLAEAKNMCAVNASDSQNTLADTLNSLINSDSFPLSTTEGSGGIQDVQFGIIFGEYNDSAYDQMAQLLLNGEDWSQLIELKRAAEVSGYDSAVLDSAVKQALINMPMLGSLPSDNGFWTTEGFLMWGYKYAQQLGVSTWNADAAFSQLSGLIDEAGGGFESSVDGTTPNQTPSSQAYTRYYDEQAETLRDCYIFYLDGVPAALAYCNQLWNHLLNDGWWDSSDGWFSYTPESQLFECEMGKFASVISWYLGGPPPQVVSDLSQKLLTNGWNSAGWSLGNDVIIHAAYPNGTALNSQLRPAETLMAWRALQATYPYMDSAEQASMDNMLTGNAWSLALASGAFGTINPKSEEGIMTAFLMGIIPGTASLNAGFEEDCYNLNEISFPSNEYMFDYADHTITIPIEGSGQMQFNFGTSLASANFPGTGIYNVTFSNDWNTVTEINGVEVTPTPPNPPVANFTWSPLPPTTAGTITFDASSSLPGLNGTSTMPIVLYSWDFGDGNTASGQIVTYAYANPGDYTVTLNVTDSEGFTNSTSQTLTVYVPVTFDQTGVGSDFNGAVLNVDGSGYGVDDLPKTFLWSVDSNHTFAYQSPLFISPGGKHYDWNSTDGLSTLQSDLITASSSGSVIGNYLSLWPTASFVWSPALPTWGETVTFDASSSLPGWDGTQATPIVLYSWDFGDNNAITANTSIVTHVYAVAGMYNVTLSVTDSEGFNDSTSQTLTGCLQVSISPGPVMMDFGQSQLFTSNAFFGTSPYTYQWYLNDTLVSGATNSTWTFTPAFGGSYTVYVDVTDSVGAQATSNTANVTVNMHDVAVTNVISSKTVVGQGYGINVTVTAEDLGTYTESFSITIYANTTVIGTQTVNSISSGTSTVLNFTWNTTGFPYGNYTISAYAWPVPGETNIANNNCTGRLAKVAVVGDITGPKGYPDGKVDIRDISYIAKRYGTTPSNPLWDPDADINGDGKVDIRDVNTAAKNYGQHYA
jgi:hypothetical protein